MRCADMPKPNAKKLEAALAAAKDKGDPITLKEQIPVVVTLDNGETYNGLAIEVRPDGLVMVQTGNCDLGVRLSTISFESS